jgi:hypothetical protein
MASAASVDPLPVPLYFWPGLPWLLDQGGSIMAKKQHTWARAARKRKAAQRARKEAAQQKSDSIAKPKSSGRTKASQE